MSEPSPPPLNEKGAHTNRFPIDLCLVDQLHEQGPQRLGELAALFKAIRYDQAPNNSLQAFDEDNQCEHDDHGDELTPVELDHICAVQRYHYASQHTSKERDQTKYQSHSRNATLRPPMLCR